MSAKEAALNRNLTDRRWSNYDLTYLF